MAPFLPLQTRLTLSIENMRAQLKEAKGYLGAKEIDVVAYARVFPGYTAAQLAQNLVTLRDEGYFREIGASETRVSSLEAMSKIAPVSVVEIEVSLWCFDQDIQDVVAWSEKNKVPVFAYSPLSRGFIARRFRTPEDIPAGSVQSVSPRFQGQAFYDNLKIVDMLDEMAEKKGLKTSQMAIAWVSSINPYVSRSSSSRVLNCSL